MKWLRNIVICVLVIHIIGSSLVVPLIELDFEVRRDYIAKILCINREKPITVCGGKCFLEKRLKAVASKQEEQQESNTPNPTVQLSFFSQEPSTPLLPVPALSLTTLVFAEQPVAAYNSHLTGIFKPPRPLTATARGPLLASMLLS